MQTCLNSTFRRMKGWRGQDTSCIFEQEYKRRNVGDADKANRYRDISSKELAMTATMEIKMKKSTI